MANLTRFISGPNVAPAIQTAQADPGAWAASANAEQQASAHVGEAFSNAMTQLGRAAQTEEKVDPLYTAQAKADLQIKYNEQLKKLGSQAKPGGSYESDAVGAFDQIAAGYLQNAPNAATQKHLAASFIGTRGNAYQHALKFQGAMDYQNDLRTFTDKSNELMGLALQNPQPQNIKLLKSNVEQYSQALKTRGYSPLDVDKHTQQVLKTFDTQLAEQTASSDPATTMDNLKKGVYNHLGPTVVNTIKTKAESQFGAQLRLLHKEHDDLNTRIINDQAIPGDVAQTLMKVKGISKYHPEIATPFKELAGLQEFATNMRTKTLDEQKQEQIHLASVAKDESAISPKSFTDMNKVLSNNIKAMEEDSLGYYAKHNLVDLPPLPKDPRTPEGQAALKQRELAASQASQMSGFQVPPFTKADIEGQKAVLESLSPIEKYQHLAAISKLDPTFAPAIAKSLTEKGGEDGLATALQVFERDPQTAQHILMGSDMLKSGTQAKSSGADDKKAAGVSIKNLFPGDPKTQDQLINAADAYRAAIGADVLTQEHVDKVSGVIKAGSGLFSSYPTIPPRKDMTGSTFTSTVEGLSQDQLLRYGNGTPSYSPGQPFDLSHDSLSNYQFKPVDTHSGQYYVTKDNKALKTQEGKLYKINLRKIVE